MIICGAAIVWLSYAGIIPLTLVQFAEAVFYIVAVVAALYFAFVILFVCRDNVERQRIGVCVIMFLGAAMFWAGFEQAGSSMNLFARDFTNRSVLGFEVTAGALQSVNPLFIILMAPVIGMIWVRLGARNPSIPVKFGLGLLLLGIGFLVLAWGSTYLETGKVGMQWLVVTYFFHTVGELCLSPVGLSSITKLAPQRLVGQMMGTWFMGTAVGNLVAGLAARYMPEAETIDTFAENGAQLFTTTAAFALGVGLLFVLFSKPIRKLCVGVN
jgi:POT family proton-dependent oligopeptide transporter